ncbi:MAG: AAA family ATPase [Planctomycetota bacterium]
MKLERVGPIRTADVLLRDLTVLVGPQATGKSLFLQFLRLVLDTGYIHDQLRKHGIEWKRDISQFLDVYLGEGMGDVWKNADSGSAMAVDDRPEDLARLSAPRHRNRDSHMFYIPAQRVFSLANGWPRPFQAFAAEDPFAIRDFSETFRLLMEQEFGKSPELFPKTNRLKREYRDLLRGQVFGRFELRVERHGAQKRLVLEGPEHRKPIPFLAWSAGQREFVPLLMGLYWLMPSARTSLRGTLKWVVIEEPKMGLHPHGISAVLLLVLELLSRGYRVCLSTHSPHVLDLVWAMRLLAERRGDADLLLDALGVSRKTAPMRGVAEKALKKDTAVYYFDREGTAHDISGLDPGSKESAEAGWGGLTEFTGRVAEVVAQCVNRAEGAGRGP